MRKMEKIRTHKDLDVWKKSIELVTEIYEITRIFPKDEIYGLTGQIRRAAISIPSNIAEGSGRNHDKELVQFLYVSLGSCSELETQIIISNRIKYIDGKMLNDILIKIQDIRKMLLGLIKAVKKRNS